MTEVEWWACQDPRPMLEFLRGRASDRKLRLFAVACGRFVWNKLVDARSRQAVEVADRFADALTGKGELRAAHRIATEANALCSEEHFCALVARMISARRLPLEELAKSRLGGYDPERGWDTKFLLKSLFIRDIVGNPFCTPTVAPTWLAWNDGTARKMAQAIYDDRAFDRLPLLADALEDAGCDNRDILDHCRSSGEHVRGCWVVDLLLGKS